MAREGGAEQFKVLLDGAIGSKTSGEMGRGEERRRGKEDEGERKVRGAAREQRQRHNMLFPRGRVQKSGGIRTVKSRPRDGG